jgi:hypothetical protein
VVVVSKIDVAEPGAPSKSLDSTQVVTNAGTVQREGAQLVDPTDPAGRARVKNETPQPYDHALAVRPVGQVELAQSADLLVSVLTELRVISRLLQAGLNVQEDLERMRRDVDVNDDPLN